mmetsp:Transcript_1320/g.2693  ORF Transcript_1320/g.2693 Transcript_1320/m.2693 type:complete len:418 (-) Transcript_1320:86-1339(-)
MSRAGLVAIKASSDATAVCSDCGVTITRGPEKYSTFTKHNLPNIHLTGGGDRSEGAIGVLKGLRFRKPLLVGERISHIIEMNDDRADENVAERILVFPAEKLENETRKFSNIHSATSEESKKRSHSDIGQTDSHCVDSGCKQNKRLHLIPGSLPQSVSTTLVRQPGCNAEKTIEKERHAIDFSNPDNSKERNKISNSTLPVVDDDTQSCGSSDSYMTGRWTREEHEAFLEGLKQYGREWKKVAQKISTRTSAQIRSHAQKYFTKLAKEGQDNAAVVNPSYHSASVIGKIELIMKDPVAVENEVNSTLQMLTERYNYLRRKIEQKAALQSGVAVSTNILSRKESRHASFLEKKPSSTARTQAVPLKGTPDKPAETSEPQINSSTSTMKESLCDGELIALEVLGGELPQVSSEVSFDSK